VQSSYGYLWVCPSGRPARPLFDFPEYGEPGRYSAATEMRKDGVALAY